MKQNYALTESLKFKLTASVCMGCTAKSIAATKLATCGNKRQHTL